MPQKKTPDRNNTTSRGSGYVAVRLTPNEVQALAALVGLAQATIDATGLAGAGEPVQRPSEPAKEGGGRPRRLA